MAVDEARHEKLDELATDFVTRRRSDPHLTITAFADTHADYATEILDLFPALVLMEEAASSDHVDGSGLDSAGTVDEEEPLAVDAIVGFRLLREIGRGGMGVVYEAVQESLDRTVAIKVLTHNRMRNATVRHRFEREARAAARLHHSNIVPVHSTGRAGSIDYYVMEYIDGVGLDRVIEDWRTDDAVGVNMNHDVLKDTLNSAQRKATADDQYRLVAQAGSEIARALEHAHEHGTLHRDIKPANILIDRDMRAWLVDFGLAHSLNEDRLTQTGDILGTLRYLSPEAFTGYYDERSEVYSLGVTLHELVTLQPAADSADRHQLMQQIMEGRLAPVRQSVRHLATDLATIIEKATSVRPEDRYQSASLFADDLDRFLNDEPIAARRPSPWERLLRWSRRNRLIAASLAAVLVLLVVATVTSGLAAVSFSALAEKNEQERERAANAERAAEENAQEQKSLRRQAEQARRELEATMYSIATERGLDAGTTPRERDGDHSAALLWFAQAARNVREHTPENRTTRLQFANWRRHLAVPVSLLSCDDPSTSRLAFDASGRLLIDRSSSECRVWDWSQETLLWSSSHPTDSRVLVVRDAGYVLIAASVEAGLWQLQLRRIDDGSIEQETTIHGPVSDLTFCESTGLITVAGRRLILLDSSTLKPVALEIESEEPTRAVRVSRDFDHLATVSMNGRIGIFSLTQTDDGSWKASPVSFETERRLQRGTVPMFVNGGVVAQFANERAALLRLSGESSAVRQWQILPTARYHRPGLAASSDGTRFAANGHKAAVVWSAARPGANPLILQHRNHVDRVAFSPDGDFVLTSSWDGYAKLWTLPEGWASAQPILHQGRVLDGCFSLDGQHFATLQEHGLIRIWRLPSGSAFDDHHIEFARGCKGVRLSRNGRVFVPSRFDPFGWGFPKTELRVFDAVTGEALASPVPPAGAIRSTAISPDGRLFAIGMQNGDRNQLTLQEIPGDSIVAEVSVSGNPQDIAFSSDSSQVAVVCGDDSVHLFECDSRRKTYYKTFASRPGGLATRQLRFAEGGSQLIVVAHGTVYFTRADNGERSLPPIEVGGTVRVAVSPEDDRVAIASLEGGACRLYSLATGEQIGDTLNHADGLLNLQFNPTGTLLVTSSRNGMATVWKLDDTTHFCPALNHPDEVYDAAISPDDNLAVTACRDGFIRFWELHEGRQIAPPVRVGDHATEVAITPDGQRCIVGVFGSSLRSFDLAGRLQASTRTLDEMTRTAEIISSRRLSNGRVMALTAEEWEDIWRRNRRIE